MTPYHIREAGEHLGLDEEDVRECVQELGGTVWDEGDDQVSDRPAHACHGSGLRVLLFELYGRLHLDETWLFLGRFEETRL